MCGEYAGWCSIRHTNIRKKTIDAELKKPAPLHSIALGASSALLTMPTSTVAKVFQFHFGIHPLMLGSIEVASSRLLHRSLPTGPSKGESHGYS